MMNHKKFDEYDLEKPKLMNSAFNIIKSILNGIIISGMIILAIGLYYLIIKAGIPYQDPTEELGLQYAINMGIGETLIVNGLLVFILGLVGRIITFVFGRKKPIPKAHMKYWKRT